MRTVRKGTRKEPVWCFFCMDRPARYEGRLHGAGRVFDLCELCVEEMEGNPKFFERVVEKMERAGSGESWHGRYHC